MSLLLDQNSTNNKKAITPTKIPEGILSSLIYGNMSDTFVYIYMYVCIYRSIVINNISTCIVEAESQHYRNWK
jgi:hypothetical protein